MYVWVVVVVYGCVVYVGGVVCVVFVGVVELIDWV